MKDQPTQLVIQALWKGLHECRKGLEKLLVEEKRAAHCIPSTIEETEEKFTTVVSRMSKKTLWKPKHS